MSTLFELVSADRVVAPLEFPSFVPKRIDVADEVAERSDADVESEEDSADIEELISEARLRERREVEAQCAERTHLQLEQERVAVSTACAAFQRAQSRYFLDVEAEVVKLALAIAGRIVQREVAMDSTLLAGVVRVALSKLADDDATVLHVPAMEVSAWTKAMSGERLHVQGDASLAAGELRLEAPAGAAELGVKAQLVEVERGFFDLLARRPA